MTAQSCMPASQRTDFALITKVESDENEGRWEARGVEEGVAGYLDGERQGLSLGRTGEGI